MKRSIASVCLFLTGVISGWWLHDMSLTGNHAQEKTATSLPHKPPTIASREPVADLRNPDAHSSGAIRESSTPPNAARFRQLLDQQEFEQAIAYYEHALLVDESYQQHFKPRLEDYLKTCLHQCRAGIFIQLVDLWLETYYEDIPILLLLSENQRLHGLPEEAASTLQLAATYALQTGPQEDVNAALQRLVKYTDVNLSQRQNWIELLGFYEYLETIDFGTETFQLRQAELYQLVGEAQRSRELLLELQKNDSRLNSEWTAILDRRLHASAPDLAAGRVPMHAISVTRRGDQFLVATSINGAPEMTLMIDTGASITTLSRASFARIAGTDFRYRGSRLFNTANGLTPGEVYGPASIALGGTQIEGLDIAVLDYESSPGVDGLLGMNVLKNYRFEIDQDKELLYLSPRR